MTKPYRRQANAIDAIYKRLQDNKEAADITEVMMGLHGVVSKAITHQSTVRIPGADSGKVYDISNIDFDRLRREFEKQPNKNTRIISLTDAVEKKLELMIARNPLRTDFYERYRKIIEEYNRETDRVTIEKTFEQLVKFVGDLSEEDQRSVKEGLNEEQLPVFDLLVRSKGDLKTRDRNRVKRVATELLDALKTELAKLDHWKEKRQTQAHVQQLIYDYLYDENTGLPVDVYTDEEVKELSNVIFFHVYQQYESVSENVYMMAAGGGAVTTAGPTSRVPAAEPRPTLSVLSQTTTAQEKTTRDKPFTVIAEDEVEPFVNSVPLLELKVAAGGFSSEQLAASTPGEYEWVTLEGRTKPAQGLFVARVKGESMNRRIPNGAWCV